MDRLARAGRSGHEDVVADAVQPHAEAKGLDVPRILADDLSRGARSEVRAKGREAGSSRQRRLSGASSRSDSPTARSPWLVVGDGECVPPERSRHLGRRTVSTPFSKAARASSGRIRQGSRICLLKPPGKAWPRSADDQHRRLQGAVTETFSADRPGSSCS